MPMTVTTAAYTHLWYDDSTGEITEADIILNDWSYTFVTDPAEAEYDAGPTVRVALLDDVVTHELGHALGLSHSGALSASMFTYAWPDQAHLNCDDLAGIHALYHPDDHGTSGMVSGRVVDGDLRGVFGAHVALVSLRHGAVVATGVTDADGRYDIGGVPVGEVVVLAEPFLAGMDALSQAWVDAPADWCGGLGAPRTLLTDAGGRPRVLDVVEGERLWAPSLEVGCGAMPVAGLDPGVDLDDPATLHPAGADRTIVVDALDPGPDWRFYKLEDVEGELEVRMLAHSLFSPVFVRAELVDETGRSVPGASFRGPVYEDDASGFTIYDSVASATGLPPGDIILAVRASNLEADLWPQPERFVDDTPFVLFVVEERATGTEGEPRPDRECAMDEDFPAYLSPTYGPLVREYDNEVVRDPPPLVPLEGRCGDRGGAGAGGAAALLVWGLWGVRRRRDRGRPPRAGRQ